MPAMTTNSAPRERDPFLEAVGRVAIAGAQLDASLRGLLGGLAFEPTLLMYANAAGTDQLIELCRLALKVGVVGPDDVAEATACLDRAKALKDKRNMIVHSIYLQAGESGGLEAMKPLRKRLGVSVATLSIGEMESVAEQIEELQHDMFRVGWNARCHETGMARIEPPGSSSEAAEAAGA